MDYEASLDRAMDSVPDLDTGDSRLDVPTAEAQKDGAFTRLTNLGRIADALSRDAEHIHSVIQRELGTNGQFDAGRSRFNGTFSSDDFDEAIRSYTEEFVICSECGLPDTHLETEGRTQMLRCEACGAFRPVEKNTGSQQTHQRPDVEEGRTYEVEITGTGRKGDGVAERGEYTIFVPGAQEGDVVEIYIENISGTLAFARLA
ncbi:translation initiation factor IF-2 subunit beta [Halococcus hamelinensis]|uniref:Translation initiation factor IF-2 subunit beta n=1 Tax=Halococcus hamelinensis 100A6 TaxID=1132509 RepID=M0MAM1_9EURY|nr:translation initiation factor IF-2 subunit beta [Halococcus hamelinensis]EMA41435.1 translation initiation factor IF-2 subunit beta [Halococcus hamelinensis 100A6]